jgi:hypothetical protein
MRMPHARHDALARTRAAQRKMRYCDARYEARRRDYAAIVDAPARDTLRYASAPRQPLFCYAHAAMLSAYSARARPIARREGAQETPRASRRVMMRAL